MAPPPSVRLLEIEPDIGRFLTADEFDAARQLSVPVKLLQKHDAEVRALLERVGAFGAVVLDGMLMYQLRIGDQLTARLLGPGDIVTVGDDAPSLLVSESHCRIAAPTRLALLGSEVLLAAHQWPQIITGLQSRLAQQTDRLATQLAVCQLPRVDQRLLALLWLLAETWGHVTSGGTTVPVSLTHDALGALIGARRPTVTLALRELTERGAIVRQDRGWLLLASPPEPSEKVVSIRTPALLDEGESAWAPDEREDPAIRLAQISVPFTALQEVVEELQKQYLRNEARFRERSERLQKTREHCAQVRERVARQRLRHSRLPSS